MINEIKALKNKMLDDYKMYQQIADSVMELNQYVFIRSKLDECRKAIDEYEIKINALEEEAEKNSEEHK